MFKLCWTGLYVCDGFDELLCSTGLYVMKYVDLYVMDGFLLHSVTAIYVLYIL